MAKRVVQPKTNRVVSVSNINICAVKNIKVTVKKNKAFNSVHHTICTNQTGGKKGNIKSVKKNSNAYSPMQTV